jgi:hypothetical protein
MKNKIDNEEIIRRKKRKWVHLWVWVLGFISNGMELGWRPAGAIESRQLGTKLSSRCTTAGYLAVLLEQELRLQCITSSDVT